MVIPPDWIGNTAGSLLQRTPSVVLGPYYPIPTPDGAGSDLRGPAAEVAPPSGITLTIRGRVLNQAGMPVAGASVEIWQANAEGRYRHASDPKRITARDGFAGYGCMRTGMDGRYEFHTVKPGAYEYGGEVRAPHIHFQVTGNTDRLVSQMFFPGDPLNEKDRFLRMSSRPQMLVGRLLPATGSGLLVEWDIVVATG